MNRHRPGGRIVKVELERGTPPVVLARRKAAVERLDRSLAPWRRREHRAWLHSLDAWMVVFNALTPEIRSLIRAHDRAEGALLRAQERSSK